MDSLINILFKEENSTSNTELEKGQCVGQERGQDVSKKEGQEKKFDLEIELLRAARKAIKKEKREKRKAFRKEKEKIFKTFSPEKQKYLVNRFKIKQTNIKNNKNINKTNVKSIEEINKKKNKILYEELISNPKYSNLILILNLFTKNLITIKDDKIITSPEWIKFLKLLNIPEIKNQNYIIAGQQKYKKDLCRVARVLIPFCFSLDKLYKDFFLKKQLKELYVLKVIACLETIIYLNLRYFDKSTKFYKFLTILGIDPILFNIKIDENKNKRIKYRFNKIYSNEDFLLPLLF